VWEIMGDILNFLNSFLIDLIILSFEAEVYSLTINKLSEVNNPFDSFLV
jgi:hypothetical protein